MEIELAALFQSHADSVATLLFGYFSVTSAFLGASYFVATTLSRGLATVVVALYSVTGLALIGYCERHGALLVQIRTELVRLDVSWHTAVSEPSFVLPSLNYTIVAAMFAIYIASIWYFFNARRQADGT